MVAGELDPSSAADARVPVVGGEALAIIETGVRAKEVVLEMLDFQVTTAVLDDGTGVVGLSGEADLYTTPRFGRDLGRLARIVQ